METNDIKLRINELITALNTNTTRLSKIIGMGQVTLSRQMTGRNNITIDTVIGILQNIPTVSPDWLLFGKGSMYRSEDKGGVSISQKAGAYSTQRASVGGSGEEYHELRIENAMLREQLKEEKARSDKYWSLIEKMSK